MAAPKKRKKHPISIVSSVITYHSRHNAGTDRKSANGISRFAPSNLPCHDVNESAGLKGFAQNRGGRDEG